VSETNSGGFFKSSRIDRGGGRGASSCLVAEEKSIGGLPMDDRTGRPGPLCSHCSEEGGEAKWSEKVSRQ